MTRPIRSISRPLPRIAALLLALAMFALVPITGCNTSPKPKPYKDPFSKIDPRFEPGSDTWWELKRDQLRTADHSYEMIRNTKPDIAAKYSVDIYESIRDLEQRYPDLGGGTIKETLLALRFKHQPIAERAAATK
ncbi:MAG: hypothetical protein GC159_03630 [Phycisphaera sp.]|nr:hypothetical protein [Phycisphaera sp.]